MGKYSANYWAKTNHEFTNNSECSESLNQGVPAAKNPAQVPQQKESAYQNLTAPILAHPRRRNNAAEFRTQ